MHMPDEIDVVTCPHCGEEQPDFGSNIRCECCAYAPMPYHDEAGELVE